MSEQNERANEEELLPCPFCGSTASILDAQHTHAGTDMVKCDRCGARYYTPDPGKWNTRHYRRAALGQSVLKDTILWCDAYEPKIRVIDAKPAPGPHLESTPPWPNTTKDVANCQDEAREIVKDVFGLELDDFEAWHDDIAYRLAAALADAYERGRKEATK